MTKERAMPDYFRFLPIDPDLVTSILLGFSFLMVIMLQVHFFKRRRRRRRRDEMALLLERFRTIVDTLEHMGEMKPLPKTDLKAFEEACERLRLVGDQTIAGLCDKCLVLAKAYAMAQARPAGEDTETDRDLRSELAQVSAANAKNLARLVVSAMVKRLKNVR